MDTYYCGWRLIAEKTTIFKKLDYIEVKYSDVVKLLDAIGSTLHTDCGNSMTAVVNTVEKAFKSQLITIAEYNKIRKMLKEEFNY